MTWKWQNFVKTSIYIKRKNYWNLAIQLLFASFHNIWFLLIFYRRNFWIYNTIILNVLLTFVIGLKNGNLCLIYLCLHSLSFYACDFIYWDLFQFWMFFFVSFLWYNVQVIFFTIFSLRGNTVNYLEEIYSPGRLSMSEFLSGLQLYVFNFIRKMGNKFYLLLNQELFANRTK